MNLFHDPHRQESYLRQCLAHDKKPIGLLLGAGAPMAIRKESNGNNCPLIPDILELTRQVCKLLSDDPNLREAYSKLCTNFNNDGIQMPNLEEILSHIRSLRQVVGTGEARGLNISELNDLDISICNKINNCVCESLTEKTTPYHKVAAWIRSISRSVPVEIFTTNYDLLMEQALEELKIPYFDGFSGSRYTFFDTHTIEDDQLPSSWARLWKLHGSINWYFNENGLVYRASSPIGKDHRQVIHPSHLKYDESRKMPYLAMIDRLKAFLKNPSSLLITCGYSYRDMHLNDVINQGLLSNPSALVYGLLYENLSSYSDAVALAQNCPNLNLIANSDAMIGMKYFQWIERLKDDGEVEDSAVIKWVEDSGKMKATVKLGDFGYLGDFFSEIIGQ